MPGVKSGGSGAAARPGRCAHPAEPAAAAPGAPGMSGGSCPGMAAARHTRREAGTVRVRRRGRRRRAATVVGPYGFAPNGPVVRSRARQRVAGPRQAVRRRRVRARRARRHGGPGMLRGAFQRRRPRRRGAVREPRAVRVGEPARRQARVAPELLGVDAALLERRVDERLQDLVRQQVDQHHLEVRAGRDRLGQRRGELARAWSACRPGRTCARPARR